MKSVYLFSIKCSTIPDNYQDEEDRVYFSIPIAVYNSKEEAELAASKIYTKNLLSTGESFGIGFVLFTSRLNHKFTDKDIRVVICDKIYLGFVVEIPLI